MKECTLLFLHTEDQILLAMKKRGFGSNRWNGVGGKIDPGETVEQALVRECQEEIEVTPTDYAKVALLDFDFPDGNFQMRVHAYVCSHWTGEPAETEEMAPRWFSIGAIPYKEMWADDEYWVPEVLAGKLIRGRFTFDKDEALVSHTMNTVQTLAELEK